MTAADRPFTIPPVETPLVIHNDKGERIFALRQDGTVEMHVEHASEAAAIFVRDVRRLWQGIHGGQPRPSVTDNARAEAERYFPGDDEARERNAFTLGWQACSELAAARAETTTEDEACGDYPAPCNCDDPETHDGALRAEATTATTEDAAMGVIDDVLYEEGITDERHRLAGLILARLGSRGLLATARTAATEDAARGIEEALYEATQDPNDIEVPAVARRLHGLLSARSLLATVRTRPSRGEVMDAILKHFHWSPLLGWRLSADSAADAVLALLADQPDPGDVWEDGYRQASEDRLGAWCDDADPTPNPYRKK